MKCRHQKDEQAGRASPACSGMGTTPADLLTARALAHVLADGLLLVLGGLGLALVDRSARARRRGHRLVLRRLLLVREFLPALRLVGRALRLLGLHRAARVHLARR